MGTSKRSAWGTESEAGKEAPLAGGEGEAMVRMLVVMGLLGTALSASARSAGGAEAEQGIASRYPGDVGIENDEHVIFVEGFEQDDWDKKWQERSEAHRKYGRMETDPRIVHSGERSLRLDILPEAGKGAAFGWTASCWPTATSAPWCLHRRGAGRGSRRLRTGPGRPGKVFTWSAARFQGRRGLGDT